MNKNLRSVLALLLVPVLMLSLAACGKQNEEETAPEETAAPEYVYTAAYKTVSGGSAYMDPQVFTEDGFYVTANEKVGTKVPEDGVIEYEGQYDIYEPRLYFVGKDGAAKKLADYEPLSGPQADDYTQAYTYPVGMRALSNGNLLDVEELNIGVFTGTEEQFAADDSYNYWEWDQGYYIRILDTNGKELNQARIDYDTGDGGYLDFYSMKLDGDDNILAISDMKLVAFKQDGSVAYTIEADDYVNGLVQLKDGRLGFSQYGEEGMELHMLDMDGHKLTGETYALPNDAYDLMPGGGDYDLYYNGGQSLYGYKLETQEGERILNWLDVDINGNYLGGVHVNGDGSIIGVLNSYDQPDQVTTELVNLTQVPYDSVPHKSELTLAVMDINYNYELSSAVIRFNRASDTSRIRVVDYAQYNTEEDYSAGLTKLTTEILSGKLPDLLCLNNLPYSQLAAKGLLEDLYPYLDADKELDRSDFFANVLKAMEVDGKLYEVTPSFTINTLIGASSVVGDTPGWTYADFNAALAKMPAGCDPLDQYTTRDDMLRTLVSLEMESLVDWNTGKVSFDSQNFIDMLNFAARFPKAFDWDNYEWTDADQAENRIKDGRQMLMNASIYYVDSIIYNDMYFGGDTTYIGYPTNEGVGSMLRLGSGDGALYAMSSKCSDKQAGWQFLRSFLLEENQKNSWGLPTNVNAFNAMLKKSMTPEYRKDADGNFVLDQNGEKIQVSRGSYGMADGSIKYVYALTQEQADKLLDVIMTTTKVADESDSIFDIVNEQAQAFFAGQKSAEEVARLIQSKANIYVNEQR